MRRSYGPRSAAAPFRACSPGERRQGVDGPVPSAQRAPRPAIVLVPAEYGPGKPTPPLPLVISPHGRGVPAAPNARLWGDLPERGRFAVICPGGMGTAAAAPLLGLSGPDHRPRADAGDRPTDAALAARRLATDLRARRQHGRSGDPAPARAAPASCSRAPSPSTRSRTSTAATRDFAHHPAPRGLQVLARFEVGGTPRTNPTGYVLRSPTHWLKEIAALRRPAPDLVEHHRPDRRRPDPPVRPLLQRAAQAPPASARSRPSPAPGATPPRCATTPSSRMPSGGSGSYPIRARHS